jgi:hypothetical protein
MWFVAFACEVEQPEPLPGAGTEIGVDVGLLRLATPGDGTPVEDPRRGTGPWAPSSSPEGSAREPPGSSPGGVSPNANFAEADAPGLSRGEGPERMAPCM